MQLAADVIWDAVPPPTSPAVMSVQPLNTVAIAARSHSGRFSAAVVLVFGLGALVAAVALWLGRMILRRSRCWRR
jgi:hypothetical protein